MNDESSRHVLSLLLENEAGALSRVSGLFSARGYNIESLSVGNTGDPNLARMTIVAHGNDEQVHQIVQQLNKLVDVVRVMDLYEHAHIEREMLIVKVRYGESVAAKQFKQLIEKSGARCIEHKDGYHVLELVAPAGEIDSFVNELNDYHCEEIVRSGVVGLGSGNVTMSIGK